MLGHRRDDVVLPALEEMGDALDGEVVRFRGAGGEDDLLRLRAHESRHLRTREREGFTVATVGVDQSGLVSADALREALRPDTVFVSVMAANNEVGTIQPIAEIGALCRERGIVFHTDAVQGAGRIPLDLHAAGVDAASLSAHKMYGPKGVGALFLSKSRKPRFRPVPQAEGGGQEKGIRSGTLNVPGIVGFGAAAELAREAMAAGEPVRLAALRDRLLEALRQSIDGVELNGAASPRLPGNLNVSIERAEAETLILALEGQIAISSGAACAEAGGKGSHVLRALGLSDSRIYTALRFGLGRETTEAEVGAVADLIASAVREARARSAPSMT